MARIVPLAEVLGLEAGELIPSVRGKVLRVGRYFAGETEKGPWSFQTITLDDGGTKLEVKIKGRDEIPSQGNVGKVMFVVAKNSPKGLSGIKVDDDSYGVKEGQPPKRIVLVTPSAEITFGKGDWSGTEAANQQKDDDTPPDMHPAKKVGKLPPGLDEDDPAPDEGEPGYTPPSSGHTPPTSRAAATTSEGWDTIKVEVNRIRKLHFVCCAAAAKTINELAQHSIDPGPEFFQSVVATLFIESCKRGLAANVPAGEPPVNFGTAV